MSHRPPHFEARGPSPAPPLHPTATQEVAPLRPSGLLSPTVPSSTKRHSSASLDRASTPQFRLAPGPAATVCSKPELCFPLISNPLLQEIRQGVNPLESPAGACSAGILCWFRGGSPLLKPFLKEPSPSLATAGYPSLLPSLPWSVPAQQEPVAMSFYSLRDDFQRPPAELHPWPSPTTVPYFANVSTDGPPPGPADPRVPHILYVLSAADLGSGGDNWLSWRPNESCPKTGMPLLRSPRTLQAKQ